MKRFLEKMFIRFFDFAQKASMKNQYNKYRKKYDIDDNFKFNGSEILLYGEGKIILGSQSYIGRHSTIQAERNYEVVIGSFCAISHYVKIYTSSFVVDQDFMSKNRRTKCGSVIIGNGVWIGANVLINPGISIGDNSIIGANSVITKDIFPNSIVGGIPATLIRYKRINE